MYLSNGKYILNENFSCPKKKAHEYVFDIQNKKRELKPFNMLINNKLKFILMSILQNIFFFHICIIINQLNTVSKFLFETQFLELHGYQCAKTL